MQKATRKLTRDSEDSFEDHCWKDIMPPDVIELLNRETRNVLQDPELGRRFLDLGLEPLPSTPDELGARMAAEVTRWARVINDAGIEKQ